MSESQKAKVLRELLTKKQLPAFAQAVQSAVERSFREDRAESRIILLRAQNPTRNDIRHRTNICYDWFTKLRGDLHYSFPKACDLLPRALRATLDGEAWEPPPAEKSWGQSRERTNVSH